MMITEDQISDNFVLSMSDRQKALIPDCTAISIDNTSKFLWIFISFIYILEVLVIPPCVELVFRT